MEQRMSLITLGVADLQRAAAFYERVIGWMAESSPPGVVFFDLNGVVFALWPHDELAKDAGMIADSVHYSSWLVELSLIWGEKKVLEYVRKLLPLSAGQVRYGEIEERVSSGEFLVVANSGSAVEGMWEWQSKGAPLVGVTASDPVLTSYFQLGVPKNSAHPNLAKLFVAFMASPEAQRIVDKYEKRSSHLVEGTRMANYVKENRLKLQPAADLIALFHEGKGLEFRADLTKMLTR